jgi:hypothetical protein
MTRALCLRVYDSVRLPEHIVEHFHRQLSGLSILLARMV